MFMEVLCCIFILVGCAILCIQIRLGDKLWYDTIYEAEKIRYESVQGWNKGKPTKQGQYIVTLDAWGHKYLDIMYYREPLLPNREVNGACWYKPSSEWGDVVYDDNVIIAWMPLLEPYKGGDNE